MKVSTQNARILIDVINKELEITRLKIENTNDLLEKNHLVVLQGLRNEFENHFFNETIEQL
jgi:thymidine kinase